MGTCVLEFNSEFPCFFSDVLFVLKGVFFICADCNAGSDEVNVNGHQDFRDLADKKEEHQSDDRVSHGGASLSNQGRVQVTSLLRNRSYLNCSYI
jgi:hypothetical protein